jgi:hypothetical protein
VPPQPGDLAGLLKTTQKAIAIIVRQSFEPAVNTEFLCRSFWCRRGTALSRRRRLARCWEKIHYIGLIDYNVNRG